MTSVEEPIFANSGMQSAAIKVALLLLTVITGCGGAVPGGNSLSGNTAVTLSSTGSANDVLTSFRAGISSLTLTSKDGVTVNLLNSQIAPDFVRQNGIIQPAVTINVPQGNYVSATASFGGGGFICVYLTSSGGYSTTMYDYEVPAPNIPVTMPAPITIAGATMGLLLDFKVSQSVSLPGGCPMKAGGTYAIQPVLSLKPIALAAQPTNSADGLVLSQQGIIASINPTAQAFTATNIYDGTTWQASTGKNTVYQGITAFSGLVVGMPVEIDEAIQADGSLAATRIQVYDLNTTALSINISRLLNTNFTLEYPGTNQVPNLLLLARGAAQGTVPYYDVCETPSWNDSHATFQVSGELANLQRLPFQAKFDASSLAPGQLIAATTHDATHVCITVNDYSSASSITLIPQTVNGTVEAISTEGGFTAYSIKLAPYDLFSTMGSQPNQRLPLKDSNTIVVYADANAKMLNTTPIAVGSVVRFFGLVFNDSGTLRMDCAQVNDGVAE